MLGLPGRLVLKGLPARLVRWDTFGRQQLRDTHVIMYGQQCRRTVFFLVGRAGAQNACQVALFKSPWLMYPSLSLLWSSHGGGSDGRIWKRSYKNANALGEEQTIDELWNEYFADPAQWWDNRVDKRNPKSPDFRHKINQKALWLDGCPPWAKAMLKLTKDRLQLQVGAPTRGFEDPAHPNRGQKTNNGKNNFGSMSLRDCKVIEQSDASLHIRSAATSEGIAILKNRVQQGIIIESYVFVEALQGCFKHNDLASAKQVHACIMKSGMEQNSYVANNLMRVYIRCGKLQEARQVFDKLVKKSIISWTIMIGGYAEHGRAKDAMEVFYQMCHEGVKPNEVTYLSILKAFVSPAALKWGKEVHAHITHGGFESDLRVGTALLKMYANSGSIDDARLIFNKMKVHDIVAWNVMIGGLAQHGRGHEAYELFLQMQKGDFIPNQCTYVSILNPCASAGALEWVKEVHNHAIKAGLESDLRVGNALVHMYAKSGSIEDALLVFDRMVNRNVFTWTVMIGGLAQHGFGHEAYRFFLQMLKTSVVPDAFTYVSILNPNASLGALKWVKEVHVHALRAGLLSDVRVGNALVHMYVKSGSIEDARQVFDRMVNRDVITWNVMIGGLAQHGRGHEAYELFLQMQRTSFVPDQRTYVSILNPCASVGVLEWVKDVHNHAIKAGLESDLRVGNALIHIYAKCDSIGDAKLVFDRMEVHDVVTWNVMIGGLAQHRFGHEAHELFLEMQMVGVVPDVVTYVSILNPCASSGALEWVKEVHNHAIKAGFESDLRVGNALVHMYAKSGSIEDALLVFERMVDRDVFTWNVMINGLAQHGCGHEAYELFLQMQRGGIVPDAITYVSILNECASKGALEWVKDVHSHAIKTRLDSNLRVGNALVHMYAKSGSIEDALLVFDRMEHRDVVTWNVMIGGLAQHGCGHEAYELFLQMQRGGLLPDQCTYVSILNPCASLGALEWVKDVHIHAIKAGLESNLRVGNALVHMYAKSGSIEDALLVFDRLVDRDVFTWNVMIGGLAQHGRGHEAYKLFLQMQRRGMVPDAVTYVSILNECASSGALEWVKEVHMHAIKAGLESDLRVGNALVHMYAKTGSIEDALIVFERMVDRDLFTWTVMIGGLGQHGCGHEAIQLFGEMIAEGINPDGLLFVSILSACSHAGLVDEGRRLFLAMTQDYDIEPTMMHYTCMVDLLARAGQLEEAILFIHNMPLEPGGSIWGALLGACRNYGNVKLAEYSAEKLFKLEPENASAYVLLSNIYAGAGKWDQVAMVRNIMQERGIRKEPGRSWIQVDDQVHCFVVGDKSHPEAKDIYVELKKLSKRMKDAGYIPDTQLVLHNISQKDKEFVLCSHSEKLAIAYGLMRTPHDEPIRVRKNLRVCSDCHTATKFISKVTTREIVVRDANRFHHFKDGVCSCGDYW